MQVFFENRRNFIKLISAAGIFLASRGSLLYGNNVVKTSMDEEGKTGFQDKKENKMVWACLMHISMNMWREKSPVLVFNDSLWEEILVKMAAVGMNTVVMDLGDAVKYISHPEIAVKNAWSTEKLYNEIQKIRRMGIEPIPKLNFSTGHDAWLGDYSRMISTNQYYDVCRDLISEIIKIYDKPRFFHLGLDEENVGNQLDFEQIIVRQNESYWGDIYFLIGEVMKGGSRPWIWQDYVRHKPEDFARMMPKSVLQSNWYNRMDFNPETNIEVKAYQTLESLGYDQVPGGSNFYKDTDENFLNNVKFCAETISQERLVGFIQSPWVSIEEKNREKLLSSIELAGKAKKWYDKKFN